MSGTTLPKIDRSYTLTDFFAALFPFDGDSLIELRALPSRKQLWIHRNDEATLRLFSRRREDCYFGVATRRTANDGSASNCRELTALFIDLDFKGSSEDEVRARLAAFPLLPSVINNSGGGLHVYFCLREPMDVSTEDARKDAKALLRRLALALGGDMAAAEVARILRLPGTLNRKYDPPRPVTIELLDASRRYIVADFDEVLPDENVAATRTTATAAIDGSTIPAGGRNAHLTSLAGSMRRRGMTPAAIEAALVSENASRCKPPLDDAEVKAIAASVGKYQPAVAEAPQAAALEFFSVRELAARVAAAGRRRFLLRGLWPAGDYGVLAGAMKAQKTWTALDMVVSVASDTPFLGHVAVESPGPGLVFLGEGSEGNVLRRMRAVAESRGLQVEDLPIVVCTRAPHLNDTSHLAAMATQIEAMHPALVVVDPLYLSARGANGADLYAMGAMLETVQHVCQKHAASLLVVHHHNRKEGTGAARISGAGPAEWGRVLLSLDVKSRHTDPVTQGTTVITELQAIGGEIADQTLRITRRITAAIPDDLDSPLTVTTTVETGGFDSEADTAPSGSSAPAGLPPAALKLLEAMDAIGRPAGQNDLVDAIAAKHGHGLRRETVSRTLTSLEQRGLVRAVDTGRFATKLWGRVSPCDLEARVISVTREGRSHEETPMYPRVISCDVTHDHTSCDPCDRPPIGAGTVTSHGECDHAESRDAA